MTSEIPKFPNPEDYSFKEKEWMVAVLLWRVEAKRQLDFNKEELTRIRNKSLRSMNAFYDRLPSIKDPKMAMIEFKAHNDELIDYIKELESAFKEIYVALGGDKKNE